MGRHSCRKECSGGSRHSCELFRLEVTQVPSAHRWLAKISHMAPSSPEGLAMPALGISQVPEAGRTALLTKKSTGQMNKLMYNQNDVWEDPETGCGTKR